MTSLHHRVQGPQRPTAFRSGNRLRPMWLDAQSGGFGYGSAEDVVVVAEDGGDLDAAADGLDVAGYGLDGGDFAAFDLGDPAFGHAHPLGDGSLGQAERLAPFGQAVAVDVGLVAVPGRGDGFLAGGGGDDVVPDVLPCGEVRHRPSSVARSL